MFRTIWFAFKKKNEKLSELLWIVLLCIEHIRRNFASQLSCCLQIFELINAFPSNGSGIIVHYVIAWTFSFRRVWRLHHEPMASDVIARVKTIIYILAGYKRVFLAQRCNAIYLPLACKCYLRNNKCFSSCFWNDSVGLDENTFTFTLYHPQPSYDNHT